MPYGNINYQKRFYYNKKFTYKDFVLQKYIDDIQFCFSQERLLDCPNIIVEVREDDGGTKQTFEYVGNSIDKASIMAFVGANSGYISKWTDQVTGDVIEITTESQQQQIINAGTWVDYTAKYNLEIPANTALTVSGIAALNRMKNLSMCSYIAFKGSVSIAGYTADYVLSIKMSANSKNDFSITNGLNKLWYFRDDSISTANRPAVTCVASGNDYLFCTNFTANNISLIANTTGVKYIGSLKDLPRVTYYLDIGGCSLLTGNVVDLPRVTYRLAIWGCSLLTGNVVDLPRVTYYLDIYSCSLLTGNVVDLPRVTYLLDIYSCSLLTGNVVDLPRVTYYLSIGGCSLLTGVYTPTNNTNTPTTFNVANTGMSALDVANTLIACDQVGLVKNGVTFTYTGLTIDATGMVAAYDLRDNHAWTFSPALP